MPTARPSLLKLAKPLTNLMTHRLGGDVASEAVDIALKRRLESAEEQKVAGLGEIAMSRMALSK